MTEGDRKLFQVRVRIDGTPYALLFAATDRADALRKPMAHLHQGERRGCWTVDTEDGPLIATWTNVATLEVEET